MAGKKSSPKTPQAGKENGGKTSGFDKTAATQRVRKILPILKKTYPDAATALHFSNPLELLIATILSAQCTDARVNMVTRDLFQKYRSAADWAKADLKQIEQEIKSCGFYHNKALNIQGATRKIAEEFGGQVPGTMEELVTLPGVGRKTANVVLGNAFGVPAIACDTHVIRLSRRLQLSEHTDDPVKLEFDLADIVPKKDWTLFSHMLIFHGRRICTARKPNCPECPIAEHCPAANRPERW
ncbi:MAG: endonuclease III [Planctomycetes bacterium]|nr:endonuclease III [Planctomycetota bacterium]